MSSQMEQAQALQKMQVLTAQKNNLASQLQVANRTTKDLQERVEAQETEQATVKAAVGAVMRVWDELNADIRLLSYRGLPHQANGAANDATHPIKEEGDHGGGVIPDDVKASDGPGCDPFLRALARGGDPKALKAFASTEAELDAKATEAERGLRRRADATKAALAALLQRMDAERQRFEARLADAAPAETADELRRLQMEAREARERADAQTALARSAGAQLAQSEAAVDRADAKVEELKDKLSDRESELAAAQRKLVMARASATAADSDASMLLSQASLALPGTPRGAAPFARGGSFNGIQQGLAGAASPLEADMQREIEGLQKTLAARSAELDAEKEVVLRLWREQGSVTDGAASPLDEAAVRRSAAFCAAAAEAARLAELAAAREAEVGRLQGSVAALGPQAQHAAVLDQAVGRQQAQLEEYGQRIADLEARLRAAQEHRDRLEQQADAGAAARGDQRTVAQLQLQLREVSTRAAAAQRQADRKTDLAARQDALSAEAATARSELQVKELALQRAVEGAAQQEARLVAAQAASAELEAQVGDLRLFVDVLLATAPDSRPAAELQAANARLTRDLEAAQGQIRGAGLEKVHAEAQAGQRAAAEALRAAHSERDAALVRAGAADRRVAQLETELADAKAEVDAFIGEIESTGTAFESMRERNQALLNQLTQRDEANASLTSERLRAQQQAHRLAAERGDALRRMTAAESSTRTLHGTVTDLEQRLLAADQELAAARQQHQQAETRETALAVDLRALNAELSSTKENASQLTKECAEHKRKAADEADELERERVKRRRLDDDNKGLQARVEKLRQAGLDGVRAEVEQELEHMRTLMRCSVCKVRQKDTVISKCWHMFCQQCIQANLANRHRKCPGCSAAFGAADVHQVFLT